MPYHIVAPLCTSTFRRAAYCLIVMVASIVGCGSDSGPLGQEPPACVLPGIPAGIATDAEARLFDYDASAPIDPRLTVESQANGVTIHTLDFASPKGGRVTGLLFVPDGPGPFAGLIVQHGLPGSARGVAGDAAFFARHGAVVVAIDAPFTRRGGATVRFTDADSAEQVQLITDLRRAVDFLVSRPDVDPARLGYRGWSYGGAMGALFAGVERRLATYILTVGDGGLVSHLTGPDDGPVPLSGLPCVARQRWLQAMIPIEPIRFVGRAAPAPLLLQSGTQDNLVPVPDAERLHQAASSPKTIRWYSAGHGLNAQAITDQVEWLRDKLGMLPRSQ